MQLDSRHFDQLVDSIQKADSSGDHLYGRTEAGYCAAGNQQSP